MAVFIPHNGCPHQCSFCNQKNITGQAAQPTPAEVQATLEQALSRLGERAKETEIAFFGGSFTAIDRDYMRALLESAAPYVPYFYGIRVSTRPDAIDSEVLSVLKAYGVTAIELGAQSMNNSVLELNKRGHTAQDVVAASERIHQAGISLGLQMMTGLYGATPETDWETARRLAALKPDTVRVYPTVVMQDTPLAALYQSGKFVPYTLEQSVNLCAGLILFFAKADINLIRLGLHYSESLVHNSLDHNYHPAFKELCESKIFYDSFLAKAAGLSDKRVLVTIHPNSLSKFLGQKKSNLQRLTSLGFEIAIQFDESLGKYALGVCNATEITGSSRLQNLSR